MGQEIIVGPLDDAHSLAAKHGFASGDDLIGDSAKSEAKEPNKDLHRDQLHPGQKLTVPDLDTSKEESLKAETENAFTVTRPRRVFSTCILVDDGKTQTPRADVEYSLRVGALYYNGKTDSAGKIEHEIPATDAFAVLTLKDDLQPKTFWLGKLCPLKGAPDGGVMGVVQRLHALGYSPGSMDRPIPSRYEPEVVSFRKRKGLAPVPLLDDELFSALTTEYGQ